MAEPTKAKMKQEIADLQTERDGLREEVDGLCGQLDNYADVVADQISVIVAGKALIDALDSHWHAHERRINRNPFLERISVARAKYEEVTNADKTNNP